MKGVFQDCKGLQNRGINLHVGLHAPLTLKAQGLGISRGKLLGAVPSLPSVDADAFQAWKTAPESRIAWASSGVAGERFLLCGNSEQGHWQNAGGDKANACNSLEFTKNMCF